MNNLVILAVIIGLVLAQEGDHKDCEPRQSSVSVRDVQDIYPRPIAYNQVDYTPHSTYGPPEPPRSASRRTYPQDISEGATIPRPVFVNPPVYNDIRAQFPLAPVYGPPPPRAKVAAAAGIYDDYDDIQYASRPPFPPPIRRYNTNYAHKEPYYGYDAYASRHHEYRLPIYYAPVAVGYYPVRTPHPATVSITTTTTEEPHTQPAPPALPDQEPYEDKRQPTVIATAVTEEDYIPRHKIFRPFAGIANLFRGSIIAKRNKIGVIPSLVQGSVNRFT